MNKVIGPRIATIPSGLRTVFKIYLNVYLVGLVSGLNMGQTLLLNCNMDLFCRCLLYRIFVNDVTSLMRLIDRFQSRGQQFCKLLGVKESFNL